MTSYFDKTEAKRKGIENNSTPLLYFIVESNDKKFGERYEKDSSNLLSLKLEDIQTIDNRIVLKYKLWINNCSRLENDYKLVSDIKSLLATRLNEASPATLYICCYFEEDNKLTILHSSRMGTATESQAKELASLICKYEDFLSSQDYNDIDLVNATSVVKLSGFNDIEETWIDICVKKSLISPTNPSQAFLVNFLNLTEIEKSDQEGESYNDYFKNNYGLEQEDLDKLNDSAEKDCKSILGKYSIIDNKLRITLYTKSIRSLACKLDSSTEEAKLYEILFKQVLLHEISHAILDERLFIRHDDCIKLDIEQPRTSCNASSLAMEESIANYMALELCKEIGFDDDEIEIVRDFMRNHQPPIYSFGLEQEKIRADWQKWKETKRLVASIKKTKEQRFLSFIGSDLIQYDQDKYLKSLLSIAYQLITR